MPSNCWIVLFCIFPANDCRSNESNYVSVMHIYRLPLHRDSCLHISSRLSSSPVIHQRTSGDVINLSYLVVVAVAILCLFRSLRRRLLSALRLCPLLHVTSHHDFGTPLCQLSCHRKPHFHPLLCVDWSPAWRRLGKANRKIRGTHSIGLQAFARPLFLQKLNS